MLPIFATILKIAPAIINTGISLIKDKSKDKAFTKEGSEIPAPTDFVDTAIEKGVSISSKRVLNLAGTTIIVMAALADITAHGITKFNIILLCIGVVYSAGMAFITYLSEKKE